MSALQSKFDRAITSLARTYSIRDVFYDLLDLTLLPLIIRDDAGFQRDPRDRYKPHELQGLIECMQIAGEIADGDGTGFVDAYGDLFMEHLSFGKNGQFFTPQPICDLMAEVQAMPEDGQTVCDPACGSGRTLLAMAKLNRNLRFYGSDVDLTCVKMAALNLALNSLQGEIAWMNTITMEHYGSFVVRVEPFTRVPYIVTTPKGVTAFLGGNPTQPEKPPVTVPEPAATKKFTHPHANLKLW